MNKNKKEEKKEAYNYHQAVVKLLFLSYGFG